MLVVLVFSQTSVAGFLDTRVAKQELHVASSTSTPITVAKDSRHQAVNRDVSRSRDSATPARVTRMPVPAAAPVASRTAPSVARRSRHEDGGIVLMPNTIDRLKTLKSLKGTVSSLSSDALHYRHAISQRLGTLQGQLLVQQARMIVLNKEVVSLTQQLNRVTLLQNQQKNTVNQISTSLLPWVTIEHHVQQHWVAYVVGLIALFLFLLWFAFGFRTNLPDTVDVSVQRDTPQEYDFLGSPEGVVAKLDLARAYFAMQDFSQMRTVLSEVLSNGNMEQRTAAQDLLNKIPSTS